ncbi:MAG: maltotransferase domain-containing protein, partial [Gemmatimonadota bacterium]
MAAPQADFPASARRRVVIEAVEPEVDGGRFPAKRTPGEIRVECDAYTDGHDAISVVLLYRKAGRRQ